MMLRPPVLAAPAAGVLQVSVVDVGGKPIPLATVELYGPENLRGFTGDNGITRFERLTPGEYEIVARTSHHKQQTLHGTIVAAGKVTKVTITLAKLPPEKTAYLRTIAEVKGKAPAKTPLSETGITTPEGKLTQSAVAALKTLPGVSMAGSGFSQYPALAGHGINETSVSIEGVPVGGFGEPVNVQMFNNDLFSGVGISEGSAYGSPGGNVDFTTRDPTLDWITTAERVEGSFDNAGFTLTEEGTSGRLGLSVTHASRDNGNPIDSMRFADSSGLSYIHDALARTDGDAFKIRYPFSMNDVLFASAVSIRSDQPMFCAAITASVPCGFGPQNDQRSSLASAKVQDVFADGRLSGSFTLYHNNSALDIDQRGRYVGGVHLPQESSSTTHAGGFIFNGNWQLGRDYPLDFHISRYSQQTASSGGAFGVVVPPVLSSLSFTDASLSGRLIHSRRFSSSLSLGGQAQGAQSHGNAELSMQYSPDSNDAISLSYGSGYLASPSGTFSGIADAASLQFNCAGGVAFGAGPSTASSSSSSSRLAASFGRTGRHVSAWLSLHHETEFNAGLYAQVAAPALDPAFFTPAYLQSIRNGQIAACGSAAPPLSLADLFYTVTAPVPRMVLNGGELHVRVEARHVTADASYGTELAQAFGSGVLFSPWSTVAAGVQLPNRPMHTANLGVAASFGKVSALANLNYVSANNSLNLPAYLTIDVGAQIPLERGAQLTFSLLNLTNAHAGLFATPYGAVPLGTQRGVFPTIAGQLQPHSINVALSIPMGPDVTDMPPPFTCGGDCVSWHVYPFPTAPPRDPFAVNRKSPTCGPELAAPARHYLEIVRSYAADVETERARLRHYPATFPPENKDGLQITYRANGSSYALLVGTVSTAMRERFPVEKPFVGCSRLSGGELEDVRNRNLYVPTYDETQALWPIALFAPAVGFYMSPPLIESGLLQLHYAPIPRNPPADPFAIADTPACSAQLRPAAEALIATLKPYITAFYAKQKLPDLPDDLKVTPQSAAGGTWLAISPMNEAYADSEACLQIAGVTSEEAQKLGLGATWPSTIDFAPRLGFYQQMWRGR
jgi:hypothetical protein